MHLRAFLTRSGGAEQVTLVWSGGLSGMVDVRRDGVTLMTLPDNQTWTDETAAGTMTYQVCEAGSNSCTEEARITVTTRRHGVRP